MSVLLRLDTSPRQGASVSRELADAAEAKWLREHPEGTVIRRDLAGEPIEHIRAITIQGFYTPEEQVTSDLKAATKLSDELIAELNGADTLLISTPIYNFSVPSSLKAWIDQVTRIGVTFGFEPDKGLFGLAKTEKAIVVAALGLPYAGTPLQNMDFLRPYLVGWLNFMGIEEVEVIAAENTSADADVAQRSKQVALDQLGVAA